MQAQSKKVYYWYGVLVVIYVLLTLLPAPDKITLAKYHLSSTGLRLLDLTILIPSLAMWLAAFYGYRRLHVYSQTIRGAKDGKPTANLAAGLLVLALGLPLSSILSSALALIARNHTGFAPAATIISNYAAVLYPLAAFIYIGMGARQLGELSERRLSYMQANLVALVVIALGVVFCDLIARSHHDISISYHMSYTLVMLTMAIPYMYIWFLGLLAVMELYSYSKRVNGILYRKSWGLLAFGLGSIIVIDIVLQYLSTMSTWLNGLSLSGLLVLLYILLLALAVAFIVVAFGTKRLMKIEEV